MMMNDSNEHMTHWAWQDVVAATRNLSVDLMLGEGGFGVEYRGRRGGRDVAVKILKTQMYNDASLSQRRQMETNFRSVTVDEGYLFYMERGCESSYRHCYFFLFFCSIP